MPVKRIDKTAMPIRDAAVRARDLAGRNGSR